MSTVGGKEVRGGVERAAGSTFVGDFANTNPGSDGKRPIDSDVPMARTDEGDPTETAPHNRVPITRIIVPLYSTACS